MNVVYTGYRFINLDKMVTLSNLIEWERGKVAHLVVEDGSILTLSESEYDAVVNYFKVEGFID